MSQNILFFSQNCQYSKKLIAKIINTPLYGSLQKVCVDDPQTRMKLPKWVNCVPMIYLAQNNPSFQNPLRDPEIWMWIESQISQVQVKQQPPQQQFQQQQQNMNQKQSASSNQQPAIGGDSMGFEPFNSLEMKGGIASDNYSMFSTNDDTMFLHSYETIGGVKGPNQPPAPPPSGQYQTPTGTLGGGGGGGNGNGNGFNQNQSDSRSSQKQEKFEQELAMKRALRDQDSTAPQQKKMDGVPQNFNQMWEQQQGRQ
jgi:hypothetical protein